MAPMALLRRASGCLAVVAAIMGMAGCASRPPAAPRPPDRPAVALDAAFEHQVQTAMAEARVAGLALAVVRGGQVVFERHYGVADRSTGRPLAAPAVMYGASLTKAAFAHLVMQLVDEGVVTLDQPLGEILPGLAQEAEWSDLSPDARWQRITLRHLLSHTSGLPNWRWVLPDRRLAILYEPGSRYVYSGEGIQLAQRVIEHRTGEPVGALMQRRVFDRFGMRDTSLTWRADFEGRAAQGHGRDGQVTGHRRAPRARAAGSMDTTLTDMALLLAAVLRGDGLSPAARREMIGPQWPIRSPRQFPSHWPGDTTVNQGIGLSAGLGWIVHRSPHGPVFFKEGNDEGTNNFMFGRVDRQDGLVLLANSANADQIFYALAERLFGTTCLPWFWMGYVPTHRAELRAPGARDHAVGPDAACLAQLN
jgi:CubicO group peptidase (beta-lactamase class C family)